MGAWRGQRVVAGIDPGSQQVGWAVAAGGPGGSLRRLASGTWRVGRSPQPMAERLHRLHLEIEALLAEWQPEALALEAAFFGRNARSALRLGESRGVILLACGAHGVPVAEIPPATVKRRVAGAGAASKEQLAALVRARYGLADAEFGSEDESDALAVAACYLIERGAACPADAVSSGAPARRRGSLPPGAVEQ